jgi:hypothetical protein
LLLQRERQGLFFYFRQRHIAKYYASARRLCNSIPECYKCCNLAPVISAPAFTLSKIQDFKRGTNPACRKW